MGIYCITFSPTGGTRRAAEAICSGLGETWVEIDLMRMDFDGKEYCFTQNDICLFAVPSYGGRVPETAAERIARFEGNGAGAVLVCVYGNRAYEDTLTELEDLVEGCEFVCVAAAAAVAEHSIMRRFAAGRPDGEDRAELKKYGEMIRTKLDSGAGAPPRVPGDRPYRARGGASMHPKAEETCIRCGICAGRCPVGAIPEEDPTRTVEGRCISCMACIAACPVGARGLDPMIVGMAEEKLGPACRGHKKNELFL